MRNRTLIGAVALAASSALAFGVTLTTPFTTDGLRAHEQKHEAWASGLALDPNLSESHGAVTCDDRDADGDLVDGFAEIAFDDADGYACKGIDLVNFIHRADLGQWSTRTSGLLGSSGVSDVWGWTSDDGREFVVVGKTSGVGFIEVTDPTAPVLLGELVSPAVGTTGLIWYDIKIVNDFAWIVSESPGHGLVGFDMTQLLTAEADASTAWAPSTVYPLTGSSHNLVANEAAEMIYVVGGNNGLAAEDLCRAGLMAIDVSTPVAPLFSGCYLEEGGYGLAGGLAYDLLGDAAGDAVRTLSRYVHDAQCVRYEGPDTDHTGKDICVTSAEDHASIVDMTNPALPTLLSTVAYETPRYTHQGWFSVDQGYFFLGDELDETGGAVTSTRTIVLDLTDLDEAKVHFEHFHDFAAIDHNMYTIGDALFQSNYTVGLRVLDTTQVADGGLPEVAYFDIHPASDNTEFSGTWSNYPYFASGTIVVTGYDGIWLLQLDPEVAASLNLPVAGA